MNTVSLLQNLTVLKAREKLGIPIRHKKLKFCVKEPLTTQTDGCLRIDFLNTKLTAVSSLFTLKTAGVYGLKLSKTSYLGKKNRQNLTIFV